MKRNHHVQRSRCSGGEIQRRGDYILTSEAGGLHVRARRQVEVDEIRRRTKSAASGSFRQLAGWRTRRRWIVGVPIEKHDSRRRFSASSIERQRAVDGRARIQGERNAADIGVGYCQLPIEAVLRHPATDPGRLKHIFAGRRVELKVGLEATRSDCAALRKLADGNNVDGGSGATVFVGNKRSTNGVIAHPAYSNVDAAQLRARRDVHRRGMRIVRFIRIIGRDILDGNGFSRHYAASIRLCR